MKRLDVIHQIYAVNIRIGDGNMMLREQFKAHARMSGIAFPNLVVTEGRVVRDRTGDVAAYIRCSAFKRAFGIVVTRPLFDASKA